MGVPIVRAALNIIRKNSPVILSGLGVTGVFLTAALSSRAGAKAAPELEKLKAQNADGKAILCKLFPIYAPTIVSAGVTSACIIGSTAISSRRSAVYASLASASELALSELKDKTKEIVGEKKEKEIFDAIAKDHVDKHPVDDRLVIATGNGDVLCYDEWSDRYFTSCIEALRRAQNDLNQRIISQMWITLNEVYMEIGLNPIGGGHHVGWSVDHLIDFRYSTQLSSDNRPCLVLSFASQPKDYKSSL